MLTVAPRAAGALRMQCFDFFHEYISVPRLRVRVESILDGDSGTGKLAGFFAGSTDHIDHYPNRDRRRYDTIDCSQTRYPD